MKLFWIQRFAVFKGLACFFLINLLVHSAIAQNQERLSEGASRSTDMAVEEDEKENVQDIFLGFCDALRELDLYKVSVTSYSDQVEEDGSKIQIEAEHELIVRQPDSLYVEKKGDLLHRKLWKNSETATLYDAGANVYAQIAHDATIDDLIDLLADVYDTPIPLSDFIMSDPCKATEASFDTISYVGPSTSGGVDCHHLLASGINIDVQLWIKADPPAYPKKFVITYKDEVETPQFMAVFHSFEESPEIEEDTFLPDLPPTATRIKLLKADRGTEDQENDSESQRGMDQ